MKHAVMVLATFWAGVAVAQITFPTDPAKLAPLYQSQRNAESDGRAACIGLVLELQAKINELEAKNEKDPR